MVKFINRLTGSEMYVPEERAEEYKKAGHKVAIEPAPKKKSTKRKVTKK